jgi:hypothetical protein
MRRRREGKPIDFSPDIFTRHPKNHWFFFMFFSSFSLAHGHKWGDFYPYWPSYNLLVTPFSAQLDDVDVLAWSPRTCFWGLVGNRKES